MHEEVLADAHHFAFDVCERFRWNPPVSGFIVSVISRSFICLSHSQKFFDPAFAGNRKAQSSQTLGIASSFFGTFSSVQSRPFCLPAFASSSIHYSWMSCIPQGWASPCRG